MDTDEGIHAYFRRHYGEWFPALREVHRTTFVRQATNLWKVKELLRQGLLSRIDYDPKISLVDSFAVPVCSFAKAPRCRGFAGTASRGFDAMSQAFFHGFRAHLRVCWPGVIVCGTLAPASEHDRWVVESGLLLLLLLFSEAEEGDWLLGDTSYWSPILKEDLEWHGMSLVAPKKTSKKRERHSWPRWLITLRRGIETVVSQLVERYRLKRVWARDVWHLTSRFSRKLLSHTCCVWLCQQAGLSSLRFSELVIH